jgi:hypothetical protein
MGWKTGRIVLAMAVRLIGIACYTESWADIYWMGSLAQYGVYYPFMSSVCRLQHITFSGLRFALHRLSVGILKTGKRGKCK